MICRGRPVTWVDRRLCWLFAGDKGVSRFAPEQTPAIFTDNIAHSLNCGDATPSKGSVGLSTGLYACGARLGTLYRRVRPITRRLVGGRGEKVFTNVQNKTRFILIGVCITSGERSLWILVDDYLTQRAQRFDLSMAEIRRVLDSALHGSDCDHARFCQGHNLRRVQAVQGEVEMLQLDPMRRCRQRLCARLI